MSDLSYLWAGTQGDYVNTFIQTCIAVGVRKYRECEMLQMLKKNNFIGQVAQTRNEVDKQADN